MLNLETVSFEINAAMRSMNAESRVIHICNFPAVDTKNGTKDKKNLYLDRRINLHTDA